MQFRPLVAVLLAVLLGLFFAPAAVAGKEKAPDQTPNDHPSGKDRSDKPADGETQGKSTSDPDGDSNGGADKPGMSGGFDDDQDGNNGCGNDDDFEDDNNGWCGGKPKANAAGNAALKSKNAKVENRVVVNKLAKFELKSERFNSVVLSAVDVRNVEAGEQAAQVLGVSFVRSVGDAGASGVLASSNTAAAPSGTLAATGTNVLGLAALAVALCNIGAVLMLLASRREVQPIPLRVDR